MWNKEILLEATRKQVKDARFNHILGVIDTAKQLARNNMVDVEAAEVAAILHDYCKAWSAEQLKEILITNQDSSWLDYPLQTWHAPAAFYIAQQQFGIMEHDLLHAIYYHTTGRARMSPLEQVLWVADYIEPNRVFPGVETARALASEQLDAALRFGLIQTMQYLVEHQQRVHPLTLEAYNYYMRR